MTDALNALGAVFMYVAAFIGVLGLVFLLLTRSDTILGPPGKGKKEP